MHLGASGIDLGQCVGPVPARYTVALSLAPRNGRLAGHRDRAPNCKKIEMVVTAGLPAIDRRQFRVVGLS